MDSHPIGRARAQTGWKMSRNLDLNVLHVDDATAWADNVAWRPVSGDTLVFDYVYFLHPVPPEVPNEALQRSSGRHSGEFLHLFQVH